MPINPNIAMSGQLPQFDSPVNMLATLMKLENMKREGQMLDLKSQAEKQDIEKNTLRNKLIGDLFASGADNRASNALYEGVAGGSIGPTTANAARMDSMPAPTPGVPNMNLNILARLAASGVKTDDLLNIHKFAQTGIKRDPNSFYEMPNGESRYIADPTKGINFDSKTGAVSAMPGFAETNADIKGAETMATEGAKSLHDLLPMSYTDQSGRPIGGSKGQYLGVQSPGQLQPPQPAPQGGMQFDFDGADLLMQIPPKDRQKIVQSAMSEGNHQFTVNYRLPNGKVVQGQVDLSTGGMQKMMQEKVDHIRSKATPEERSAFLEQAMQSLSYLKDPVARMARLNDMLAQLQEPVGTPIRFGGAATPKNGAPLLQSEAEKKAQLGRIDTSQQAQGDVNKNWTTNSYQPVIQAGRDAQNVIGSITALRNINMQTGWGTEAMANAANVLSGLGIASESAKQLATNAQMFQSNAMERLWTTLNAAKGPQTEGDADRAKATWAQLRNTPQANQYILDLAEARAKREAMRAQYYADALPLAIQEGDLTKVDREWNKIQSSIWSDPNLQKYVKKGGK
jgi:hypothetical protein